jgi:hypothetical protein
VRTRVSLYYPNPPVFYANLTNANYLQGEYNRFEGQQDNSDRNELERGTRESQTAILTKCHQKDMNKSEQLHKEYLQA